MKILRAIISALVLTAFATTFAQQTVTPPPQPAGSGPSLAVTMQFIQDKLSDIGQVSFVAFLQSTSQGNTWTTTVTNEISNVVADQNQCRISYHWKGTDLEALSTNETAPRRRLHIAPFIDDFADLFPLMMAAERKASSQTYSNEDYAFSLRAVQDIVVKPWEQYGTERLAKHGHPDTTITSTNPPITALVVRQAHGVENVFTFTDADLADRVAKAMVHAVELCGGGKSEEPF
ncbi:MAG: hypothetical protein ABR990_13350 [Terracidiphilus sp.]|jgi:hypothetical protein